MFLVILGLILFIGLVMIHELGHFVAARKSGVTVEEYGLGFPPKLYGKKLGKHQTEYTVNALPLGGFVRLKGEHDMDVKPGDFGAATLWQKLLIIAAGVIMNLVTAFVILTILALFGVPHLVPDQYTVPSDTKVVRNDLTVGGTVDDSPASKSGLQRFDRIVSITELDGCTQDCTVTVPSPPSNADVILLLQQTAERFQGKEVKVTYARQGATSNADVTMKLRTKEEAKALAIEKSKGSGLSDEEIVQRLNKNGYPYSGIGPTQIKVTRHTWSAPVVAGGTLVQLTRLTLDGLGNIFTSLSKGDAKGASENVSGPLGVFFILKDGSEFGLAFVMMIIAVISLTLAIMNVLPIPALDGGRLFVILLFHALSKLRQKFKGKPLLLRQKTEDMIHGTGFAVMMLLFILITFVDIKRFF